MHSREADRESGCLPFRKSQLILRERLIRPWEDGKALGAYYQVMDPFPPKGLSTLLIRFVGEDFLEIELVIKELPP